MNCRQPDAQEQRGFCRRFVQVVIETVSACTWYVRPLFEPKNGISARFVTRFARAQPLLEQRTSCCNYATNVNRSSTAPCGVKMSIRRVLPLRNDGLAQRRASHGSATNAGTGGFVSFITICTINAYDSPWDCFFKSCWRWHTNCTMLLGDCKRCCTAPVQVLLFSIVAYSFSHPRGGTGTGRGEGTGAP